MREIKFRVWDGKKMWDCEDFRFNTNWDFNINWSAWKSLPDRDQICNQSDGEIMQYTGLKDKNGKEIYELDIIDGLAVTYCADTGAGLGMHTGWYLQRGNFESWTELMNSDGYEVIGNTYENPNLLLENNAR